MLREVAIELNQRTKAATQIQAVVRRLAIAPILKVLQLEFQLRTIEKARISELRAIDEWKAKKMRVVREKYEAKVSIITEQERKTAETVDAAILHISHLRKVNARLRAKNETLRSAIDQLLVENKMLNAEASKYSNFRELTASMSKADKDNSLKRFMLDEFESRKVALEVAIESRDERIMLENKIGRLYFNATKSIVLHMENTCHDDSLVYTIEDMCLELENRCSGLDETECDGSEEDFPSP